MKSTPVIILFILFGFFTSCNEDEVEEPIILYPSLTVSELNSDASDGAAFSIEQGQTLKFYWEASKGTHPLDSFFVEVQGENEIPSIPPSDEGNTFPYDLDDDSAYSDSLLFPGAGSNIGSTIYSFRATDIQGNSTETTFNVETNTGDTRLSDEISFIWQRIGENPATGLDQFGLAWNQNTEEYAVIERDQALKMVALEYPQWATIETEEELYAAIDEGEEISEYLAISVTTDMDYSSYLGVIYDNQPYMISIIESSFKSGPDQNVVTVLGQYRN